MLDAEHAKNELRKDFTPTERVAIKRAIEEAIGKRQGQRTDQLLSGGREVAGHERTTSAIAAKKAGFTSVAQATRAEIVVKRGAPEVMEATDKGKTTISEAYNIARLVPKDEQAKVIAMPSRERQAAIQQE